jgi:hypothetical protein
VPSGAPLGRSGPLAALLVVLTLSTLGVLPSTSASGPPALPIGLDRFFVENVVGAELSPGASGSLSMQVHDPLAGAMTTTVLTVGVYAFNAFPGNATSQVDVASAPVLSNATSSALEVNESLGTLASGAVRPVYVPVVTGASTPSGTFAVRTALTFVENGTSYRLASRGWFTSAQWNAATSEANGSVTVNVTQLGVSGILPETSVLVTSNDFSLALWGLLGAGILVVALGAWLYFRRSNSSSGTRPSPEETQAPRAFGRSRTRDGD